MVGVVGMLRAMLQAILQRVGPTGFCAKVLEGRCVY